MAYKKSNPNGQATMANSEPVVLASDHSDVKVTLDSEAVVLGAGSAAIGKLAANSGVDIGDVDVATVGGVAPAFGTGLRGATVQRVTIATDDSVPVTNAGITTIAGAISGTEMQVDVLTMPTVTETNSSAIKTAAELIDDAIVADDAAFTPATTKVMMAGFEYDDTTPDSVNEGDAGAARMSARREVYTQIRDAAGNERGLNVDANGAIAATVTNATAGNLNMTEANSGSIKTAVELIDDMVVAQGTALGTTKVNLNGASVTTAAPTYTTGQISPLNLATTGALRVDVGATSANATAIKVNVASGGIASGAIASGAIAAGAIAAGATSIATTEDTASAAGDHLVKVAQIRLDTPVSGANTSGSGDYTQFIADSFGKTWTAGTYAEDLAHVAGEPIRGNGARRIDTAASSAGTSGDWATVDASAEGALWTTLTPTTTSGVSTFRTIDLDETEEEIKATAGNVYGYYYYNAASSVRYLKWYNATAASVSVGTTTPVRTYPLPAGAAGHIALPYPISFSTAICVAATTGLADNDTGAPGANEVILNVDYK